MNLMTLLAIAIILVSGTLEIVGAVITIGQRADLQPGGALDRRDRLVSMLSLANGISLFLAGYWLLGLLIWPPLP